MDVDRRVQCAFSEDSPSDKAFVFLISLGIKDQLDRPDPGLRWAGLRLSLVLIDANWLWKIQQPVGFWSDSFANAFVLRWSGESLADNCSSELHGGRPILKAFRA